MGIYKPGELSERVERAALVVDDENMVLSVMMTRMGREIGKEVAVVFEMSVDSAMSDLRTRIGQVSVALIDFTMPVGQHNVFALLRELVLRKAEKILVMSGGDEETIMASVRQELGPEIAAQIGYLQKPSFMVDDLPGIAKTLK